MELEWGVERNGDGGGGGSDEDEDRAGNVIEKGCGGISRGKDREGGRGRC